MLFCDFHSKLKKLNSRLWVDCEREINPYHKDFPMAGLYFDNVYIMGIPHNLVPEYTIIAVNGKTLGFEGYPVGKANGNSGIFFDKDFIENIEINDPSALQVKVLSKGYRAILSELINRQLIDRNKAERLFGCQLEPQRKSFPKRYIDLSFTERF